ncbi:hypothetical protein IP91_01121 [Pseudoduganella lurida]|uniref:Uncharacterized protein n=1 Tax=Pseudoduganella lurida TaxID=1036180 RepID=A0A562RMD4_9BURK|nr:hypothetical protein [Pseudoduganella lurida]TWI70043.1 hypothetical protein IP91_01121 [Pseudoduganella lurida]
MKIDTATGHLYASRSVQSSTTARVNPASFSAALTAAAAGVSESVAQGTRQADFTSMTRQEMQDWSNDQIRSGKMSLDEGRPFMAMSMKMPVVGGTGGGLQASSDGERLDFMQKVRAGIEGALSRNDDITRQMLESAMKIMQQSQGETIGVDTRA